jgi:hypothetical protein
MPGMPAGSLIDVSIPGAHCVPALPPLTMSMPRTFATGLPDRLRPLTTLPTAGAPKNVAACGLAPKATECALEMISPTIGNNAGYGMAGVAMCSPL